MSKEEIQELIEGKYNTGLNAKIIVGLNEFLLET